MPFTNLTVDVDSLPRWEKEDFNKLDERYFKYKYIRLIALSILLLIATSLGYWKNFFNDKTTIMTLFLVGLIFVLIIISVVMIKLQFRNMSYVLREKDIIYNAGIFWKSQTIIPFARIQHTAIVQSPIQRNLGLANLKLYTAGGSVSDLKISSLSLEKAQDLKEFINNKSL